MILVTGGTGLVGSHLLYHLTQEHNFIKATYRSNKKIEAVKHVFSYYSEDFEHQFSKIEWIETTLNDLPKLTVAFKDITHVYHCAALVSFDPNDYDILKKINIEGTANIVNLCISNTVQKLCYVSTIAAVGDSTIKKPLTEETPWNSEADHSVYAITKYGAELEVWRGSQEGLNVVIVNPGIIIGPGFWRSSSGRLFKKIYGGLKYFTNGISSYIDISDVVKPMVALMESQITNERYILVAENLSFKTFTKNVANALQVNTPKKEATKLLLNIAWRYDWLRHFITKKPRRITKQSVSSLTSNSHYSNNKIKTELNYSFKPITVSIQETSHLFLKDQASH